MSNSCIWPIYRTISGTTNPGQSGPGGKGNEEVFPKAPGLETHHRMQFSVLFVTLVGGGGGGGGGGSGFLALCILQPRPTVLN